MATIKSYSDLEQSRKLAEILPLESADMFYAPDAGIVIAEPYKLNEDDDTVITAYKGAIPCWSLAALLSILHENKICHYGNRHYCQYMSEGDEFPTYSTAEYNNSVDACYEMILKLHELKML